MNVLNATAFAARHPLTLRAGKSEDACAAVRLLRRSIAQLCQLDHEFDNHKLGQWLYNKNEDSWQTWVSKPEVIILVAERQGEIVGVSAMSRFGLILLNFVAPEAQYQGVSKAMLHALEDEARALGLARVLLNTTLTAQRFYQDQGYVPAKGGAYGDLKLEKTLIPKANLTQTMGQATMPACGPSELA